jgi:WD40 repeat protein
LATYNRHSAPIECVSFSPNRRLLASASLDGPVKEWEVPGR